MSVTLGESFTSIGRSVARRTALTSCASSAGRWPNSIPPLFTCGHDAFTSSPATRGAPVRRFATSA